MSLSRKSEGDSCGPALLGGFISSLQELSLTLARKGAETKGNKRERIWKLQRYEHACAWTAAVGVVGKVIKIQQKWEANTFKQISQQWWNGKQGKKKLQANGLPQLPPRSLSISNHLSLTYCGSSALPPDKLHRRRRKLVPFLCFLLLAASQGKSWQIDGSIVMLCMSHWGETKCDWSSIV